MKRQIAGFFIRILLLLLLLGGLGFETALATSAGAKESHTVTVSIPEILRLAVGAGANEVVFDLTSIESKKEDSPAFPFYVEASKYIEVKVLSNTDREWQLKVQGESLGQLPLENIEWSVDNTTWHPLHGEEQVMTTGLFTKGWQVVKVYYRLLLTGNEYAGEHKLVVNYGLTVV